MLALFALRGLPSSMSGAALVESCESLLFRVLSFLFSGTSLFLLRRCCSGSICMEQAMVPDNVAAAFVAVYPLLLSAIAAADGSKASLYFKLFFFGFLLSSTFSAC